MLLSALVLACLAQETSAPRQSPAAVQVPLPRRAMPADTAFVLHVDPQVFLASAWWSAFGELPEVVQALRDSDELRMAREQFGLDPFRDLLSVTVFGRDSKGGGGVVLVRTTDAADRAIEMVRAVDEHSSVESENLQLDFWGDATDGLVGSFHATPAGERVAILGRTVADVTGVIRAADGVAPRLADVAAPAIAATPRQGTFFYLEVGLPVPALLESFDVELPGGDRVARLANGVQRLRIELGEAAGGDVFLELRVSTKDRRDARRIADAINGARAFISNFGLLEQLPFAAQDLYEGLIAEVEGNDVRLGLEIPPRDLTFMLQELRGR